jgi:structure-specific recognition protein 1
MTSNYMHMQGAQYAYKIKYEDINSLFLLPKLDGGRMAFVIALEKPIRQGNQKYQNLVLETHKLEHTMQINLSEDEIAKTYDGQLTQEMTMPMSSLIAKIFKVLSQKKVFIPKQFVSARDAFAVRCSIKANDGLLYPLAKAFIFINKPCIIIKFEDIDFVEFRRFEPAANSGRQSSFFLYTHLCKLRVPLSAMIKKINQFGELCYLILFYLILSCLVFSRLVRRCGSNPQL